MKKNILILSLIVALLVAAVVFFKIKNNSSQSQMGKQSETQGESAILRQNNNSVVSAKQRDEFISVTKETFSLTPEWLSLDEKITKEYEEGDFKIWETAKGPFAITDGDTVQETEKTTLNLLTGEIKTEQRRFHAKKNKEEVQYGFFTVQDILMLRKVIANDFPESNSVPRLDSSSQDGVWYKGSFGAPLYASKASGSWKYVTGNGFSCKQLLDIGIPKEVAQKLFTSDCQNSQ